MARVCFPFVGDLIGGSHVSTAGLIAQLDRDRVDPLVLLQHDNGAMAAFFAGQGIDFERAPATPDLEHGRPVSALTSLRLAGAAPRLARFLRQRSIDIVHCNDGRTLATWAVATRLAGAQLLWHHRGSPDAAGLRLVAPMLADRVVAVSHFASPRPGRYSAAARTRVIHSPFDTATVHDRRAARATVLAALPGATADTRVVAFSGVLIDRKRPLLFVEAIAALRRRSPGSDVRGILLGTSLKGMDERVRHRAELLGIADAIHVLGHRTPGPFWLAGCDVLMVPAVDEPFGRTLIEAMLAGTPVVATASGGNGEAIRHRCTGMIVPPEDAEALGEACRSLLLDPIHAAAIAVAARAESRARYGEAAHGQAVMALYADMLAARRRSGHAPVPARPPMAITQGQSL